MPILIKKIEPTDEGVKLRLQSPENKNFRLTYDVSHSTSGRVGASLHQDLQILTQGDQATAAMTLDDMQMQGSIEEALDKMADWLERMALAIRERGEPATTIPVKYKPPTKKDDSDEKSDPVS